MLWLLYTATVVTVNCGNEQDCVLVLGGSAQREIYSAVLARKYPARYIVISGGQFPQCTARVFVDAGAPIERVILEQSATSTFENFFYSISILKRINAKRVGVVTSIGNEQRGLWMARIFLWANGLAVDNEVLPGSFCQSGHDEEPLKTFFDVTRTVLVAPLTVFYHPAGKQLKLADVNVSTPCQCTVVPPEVQEEYERVVGLQPYKKDRPVH